MLVYQIIKKNKDKVCLIYNDKKITYSQLDEQSDYVACQLQVNKADKVGIKITDPVQQLVYFFAIVKKGAIGIFMPENLVATEQLDFVIDDNFILSSEKYCCNKLQISDQKLFLGVFSSGSTGTAKLILREHQSWLSAFDYQSELFTLNETSIVYLVANLAYSANLNTLLHTFYLGATAVLTDSKNIRIWLEDIKKYNIDSLFMVPAYYQMLVKKSVDKNFAIKSIVSGGAKMDLELATNLQKKFPNANICQYYGASEIGHISYALYEDMLKKPNSVGRLFPEVSLDFIDTNITVKSPYLAYDYKPLAKSGDLGYLDNEGYLFLTGRKQEVINIAGVKIALSYIEQVLSKCEKVEVATTISIADKLRGEAVCAFVVKKSAQLTRLELIKHCQKFLNSNICPQKIVFLDKLPLNDNGKIDKIKLKAMVQ